jgi:hypothetical protein
MLRVEHETFKLHNGEAIEDFALRFSGIVQHLVDLGDPEPDAKAAKKFLRVVRPRYKQLAISMEDFVDISKLSIEEITGMLKSSYDAKEEVAPPPSSSTGKLLLTHEEWLEKTKGQDDGRGGSSSGEKKDQNNRRGKSNGGDGGGRGEYRDPNKPPASPYFKCHKTGHWARYCPNRPKKKAEVHLAQGEAEEDQPTLLMAWASTVEVNTPFSTFSLASSPPPPATGSVDIQEEKVYAQLDMRADREPDRWVLDSGATNHMMGACGAFAELDRGIHGTVHFDDGSVVKIDGRGTVVFSCKNREHRGLTGCTTSRDSWLTSSA